MHSLTVDEARGRAAAVSVTSYDVELDLTRGPDHFGSRTEVVFDSLNNAETFIDIRAYEVTRIELNGTAIDPAAVTGGRLTLGHLQRQNRLVVDGLFSYSHDGEGLHRAVDPEDKQAYVYAMTFLPGAPRIFACFDQPDLKAVYRLRVHTPTDWVVVGNGAAEEVEPGSWTLRETKPLSTYFATVVAGPYHSVTTEHDGIRLGLHCRQSLAPHLDKDADELFEVTGQCFDEYHRLFAIRYPFGEYHQAFVPEFNAGAMENPGCVTFSDTLVFKAQATDSLRAARANVVAHEMAHQWFGDLVTMRWWDDLWLNESFAEYMGYRVTSEVTRFDDVWVEYAYVTKAWGMAADQRRSTHPIAGNGATDAQQALTDFDGISYSKGTAALRQLNAYLGDEAFMAGVIEHLNAHAYGNATLADLLGSWERASDKDVHGWADAWLTTSGVDVLAAEVGQDRVAVRRTNGSPVDVNRPHTLTLTAYDAEGADRSFPLVVDGDVVGLEAGGDLVAADGGLLLPDAKDETWAKVRLDEASLQEAATLLPKIENPLARAVIWGAFREGLLDATIDPGRYLDVIEQALPHDSDLAVEHVLGSSNKGAIGALGRFLSADTDRSRLAAVVAQVVRQAAPGSNRQLVAVRQLIELSTDVDLLDGWWAGTTTPDGLVADEDFRWRVLRALCALGARGPDAIEAEMQRDPSSEGAVHALECRSSLPDARIKDEVWSAITSDASLSNYELYALAGHFFRREQAELTRPYVSRYFAEMPSSDGFRTGWIVERATLLAYPRFFVDTATLQAAERALSRDDLSPGVRRSISDATDDLQRALASKTAFPR